MEIFKLIYEAITTLIHNLKDQIEEIMHKYFIQVFIISK